MNMCGPGSSVGFSPKLLLTTAYQPLISATFSLCDFYWCVVQEARLSLHLTGVQIVLENSANISLHYPPTTSPCFPLLVSFSLLFPSVEKVKSRPIGIRVSISVFAGLCNRKRQAAGWALRQQITVWKREVAVGMGGGVPLWPGDSYNVIVRAGMKSALTKWGEWWMDKAGNWMWEWMRAEGEFNTDKQNERQRGIACSSMPALSSQSNLLTAKRTPKDALHLCRFSCQLWQREAGRFQLARARLRLPVSSRPPTLVHVLQMEELMDLQQVHGVSAEYIFFCAFH